MSISDKKMWNRINKFYIENAHKFIDSDTAEISPALERITEDSKRKKLAEKPDPAIMMFMRVEDLQKLIDHIEDPDMDRWIENIEENMFRRDMKNKLKSDLGNYLERRKREKMTKSELKKYDEANRKLSRKIMKMELAMADKLIDPDTGPPNYKMINRIAAEAIARKKPS